MALNATTSPQVQVSGALSAMNSATKATIAFWHNRSLSNLNVCAGFDNSTNTSFTTSFAANVWYIVAGSGSSRPFGQSSTSTATGWAHACMVFDGTAGTNADRLKFYVDAVQLSLTFSLTIPAALNSSLGDVRVGRSVVAALWSIAQFAEFSCWNDALTQQDIKSLVKGFSPRLVRPQSLVACARLIAGPQNVGKGGALTGSNDTYVTHPRVYG